MTLPPENEITPKELHENRSDYYLVDVREPDENAFSNIKEDIFIPLGEFTERYNEIPKDKKIVIHCRSGGRSEKATHFLLQAGFQHVKNLVGGIRRWADEVDPSIPKY